MLIGYARVSTSEQDTAMQLAALRKAGVRKVFEESRSAVKHRPQLVALLDTLRAGDVLVVYKLDRLARSMRDLLDLTDRIDQAGARFRSLTEAIDTSTPAGEMVMHMIGAMAQFERGIIRERSIAGMEVARANGVRFGRAPALDARATAQMARQWESGRYSKTELAKMHGVSISTVKRTLWRRGLDTISEAHANGMHPPFADDSANEKARAWRAVAKGIGV
jgi:DNA invertase Pin-like site-specific DNA recombinase